MRLIMIVVVLVAGVLAMAGVNRWRFVRAGGAFRCRIRAVGPPPRSWPRLRGSWSRWIWARWSGESLVVRPGRLGRRTVVLPAVVRGSGVYHPRSWDRAECGLWSLAVELDLGDARIDVAASGGDRLDLVGPYLTAALCNLPRSPAPWYRPRPPRW